MDGRFAESGYVLGTGWAAATLIWDEPDLHLVSGSIRFDSFRLASGSIATLFSFFFCVHSFIPRTRRLFDASISNTVTGMCAYAYPG